MIYVASYATFAEFAAEQDNPSADFESMASPRLVDVAIKITSDWIDLLKASLFEEFMDLVEGGPIELTWKTSGWNEANGQNGCRPNQIWDLMDGELVVGKLVVQRVPVSEV